MLVWMVYVPTADLTGPDVERMNRIEDVPDELGRLLLADGSARRPSDEELAAYEKARKPEVKADAETPAETPASADRPATRTRKPAE